MSCKVGSSLQQPQSVDRARVLAWTALRRPLCGFLPGHVRAQADAYDRRDPHGVIDGPPRLEPELWGRHRCESDRGRQHRLLAARLPGMCSA